MSNDPQRERDVDAVCRGILDMESVTDYNPNSWDEDRCPFCCAYEPAYCDISNLVHDKDCIYLIAKDLMAGKDVEIEHAPLIK